MAYSGCRFCGGRGCLACEGEREKASERFQKPIFTADPNNEHDMKLLKEAFGREAIEKALGPDGGGVEEIRQNAAIASLLQLMRKLREGEQEEANG